MSINAAKGVEIGAGFEAAELSGEENADEMRLDLNKRPVFLSNKRGRGAGWDFDGPAGDGARGLQADLVHPDDAPDHHARRRGDGPAHQGPPRPCVALRAVPVVEAMAACVLADAI
jgi:chorismate synthase